MRRRNGVAYYGKIRIGKRVRIWPPSIIGFPGYGPDKVSNEGMVTIIEDDTEIMPFTTICQGARIGADVSIDESSRIGCNTSIGDGTRIVYGAKIYDDVRVGGKSIVSGFCCDRSRIGNRTTMMGVLVHTYPRHAIDTWEEGVGEDEPSPVIKDRVIVGFGSIVIGGVTVNEGSYIGAGAVITHDVPPNKTVICRRKCHILARH